MAYAVIEKSGSGVAKNVAKLRIDCFLNPDDPNYDKCYVNVPVIPPEGYPGKVDKEGTPKDPKDYDAWLESLPHIWINAPFHHNKIWLLDAGVSDNWINEQIERTLTYFYNFHQYCWGGDKTFIDEWKKVPKVKGSIRDIFVKGDPKDSLANQQKIADITNRINEFQIGVSRVPPTDLNIGDKGTITVGTLPVNRASSLTGSTIIEGSNPANADGIIDTAQVYPESTISDFEVATFYLVSGTNFSSRDYEAIGTVTAGEPDPDVFTGLSLDILTGDYIGCYVPSGTIEKDNSGGTCYWYRSGDYIPATNDFFVLADTRIISLYGTGTESGGGTNYPINLSVGLTASVSIDRDVTYSRATSTASAISTTISKSWGRIISTATALSVATSILKGWGRTITTSTALSVSTTISKSVAFKRAVSAGLTVATTISAIYSGVTNYLITTATALVASVSISRAVTYTRASQTALSVAVSIVKSWGRTITTATALAVSTTISRTLSYNRATSSGLTVAVSVVKSWGRTITTSTALSVSTTISRALTFTRATASNLSASVTIARSVAYNRAVSAALSISASITALLNAVGIPISFTVSLYPRALSISLNKRSMDVELHKQDMTVKVRNKE
jgi:hypothetical protein